MSQLQEIQRAFLESLYEHNDSAFPYIAKTKDLTEEDRLRIYCNDYFFRLRDSLKEDFKKTYLIVGDERFDCLVQDYLKAYPSETYTLREVGLAFPKFLEEQRDEPGLIELAKFECEMIKVLYAPDEPTLSLEELSEIDADAWMDLVFHIHPSVRKFIGMYNTCDVWSALECGDHVDLKHEENPSVHLVWRHGQTTYFCMLSNEELVLFDLIQSGKSFSELCEAMLAYFEEEKAVSWVAGILQRWIPDGIFASL